MIRGIYAIWRKYIYFNVYTLSIARSGCGGFGNIGGMHMKKTFLNWEELEDETIYSEEYREHLIEDGELSPEEEAFMRGYEEAG